VVIAGRLTTVLFLGRVEGDRFDGQLGWLWTLVKGRWGEPS